MIITKEVILKIELSGQSLKDFIKVLEGVLAANYSANQGLGFLQVQEKKMLEELLKKISNE